MKVETFLYSRTKRSDYRWLIAPTSLTKDIRGLLTSLIHNLDSFLSSINDLPIFLAVLIENNWYCLTYYETNSRDNNGRLIDALVGVTWGISEELRDREIIYWSLVSNCKNLKTNFRLYDDSPENLASVSPSNIDKSEISNLFNDALRNTDSNNNISMLLRGYRKENLKVFENYILRGNLNSVMYFGPECQITNDLFNGNHASIVSKVSYENPLVKKESKEILDELDLEDFVSKITLEDLEKVELSFEIFSKKHLFSLLFSFLESLVLKNNYQPFISVKINDELILLYRLNDICLSPDDLKVTLTNPNSVTFKKLQQKLIYVKDLIEKEQRVELVKISDFRFEYSN